MELDVIASTIAVGFVLSEGKREKDEEWRKEVEEGKQENGAGTSKENREHSRETRSFLGREIFHVESLHNLRRDAHRKRGRTTNR